MEASLGHVKYLTIAKIDSTLLLLSLACCADSAEVKARKNKKTMKFLFLKMRFFANISRFIEKLVSDFLNFQRLTVNIPFDISYYYAFPCVSFELFFSVFEPSAEYAFFETVDIPS